MLNYYTIHYFYTKLLWDSLTLYEPVIGFIKSLYIYHRIHSVYMYYKIHYVSVYVIYDPSTLYNI